MNLRSLIVTRVVTCLLPILLFGNSLAQAGMLRYDITFNDENLGRLLFDTEIGASGQDLWGSLVDWDLGWEGVFLNPSNSSADPNVNFFVDASGDVFNDGSDHFDCVFIGGPICQGVIVVTDNPYFFGNDGSSIEFFKFTSFTDSLLTVFDSNGVSSGGIGKLVYSGPTMVPLPATIWLIGVALLGVGVTRYRTGA